MEYSNKFTASYEDRILTLTPFTKMFSPWQITMCDEVWTINEITFFGDIPKYHSEHRTFELAFATAKML